MTLLSPWSRNESPPKITTSQAQTQGHVCAWLVRRQPFSLQRLFKSINLIGGLKTLISTHPVPFLDTCYCLGCYIGNTLWVSVSISARLALDEPSSSAAFWLKMPRTSSARPVDFSVALNSTHERSSPEWFAVLIIDGSTCLSWRLSFFTAIG